MIYRNVDYLKYIRSLPCLICGNPETGAHHIRRQKFGAGVGVKPHDYVCVPLCGTCHSAASEKHFIVEDTIINLLMKYIEGKR